MEGQDDAERPASTAPAAATERPAPPLVPAVSGTRPWGAIVQVVLAVLLFVVAVSPPLEEVGDANARVHHLLHAAIMAAGALLGRLAATWWLQRQAQPVAAGTRARAIPAAVLWSIVSLGPIVLMAAMVPATSSFVEDHEALHVAEHLSLFLASAIIAAAGARLAPSLGRLMTLSLPLMAALFAGIVAPSP